MRARAEGCSVMRGVAALNDDGYGGVLLCAAGIPWYDLARDHRLLEPLLMRTNFRTNFFLAAVVLASAVTSPPLAVHAQSVAPCTHATTACEQWIVFGAGPARSMVYSTYSLDKPNAAMTRALIMVHGANRNADHYFETATSAGFLAGALNNTVIIAPHFTAGKDKPAANEVMWPERRDSWRSGGMSPTNPDLSSFDFVDEIVRKLANKKNFPNLKHIVITGHSAGGQFATR
jgi:poly(3-hydroxybutyrate) depolymerase